MAILEQAYTYFTKIMNKEESFVTVMNRSLPELKASNAYSSEEVTMIRDMLKSTVNKYYFLRYEVRKGIVDMELEPEETNVLILGLALIHYVKDVNLDMVMEFFKEDYNYLPLKISLDQIRDLYTSIGDHPMELPEKVDSVLSKKISMKYSYPEWMVKMLFKHFGVKNTYRSCASSRHSMPIVVNINPMKFKNETLDPDLFTKSTFTDHTYNYLGKEKIITNPTFKSNKIFVEDEALQFLVDKLEPSQGEEMLFIDDSKGICALDATLKVHDLAKVSVATNNVLNVEQIRNLAHRFQVKSMDVFALDRPNLLITHVAPKSKDKVLLIPDSSKIGLIRKHPDILLTLRRQDLDEILASEKEYLNEAAATVKDEGILIYSVFTLNKKESEAIITDFLKEHSDFSLLEQRQYFPFEGPCDGFYYAKLQRTIK